eukprot:gene14991-biopygen201
MVPAWGPVPTGAKSRISFVRNCVHGGSERPRSSTPQGLECYRVRASERAIMMGLGTRTTCGISLRRSAAASRAAGGGGGARRGGAVGADGAHRAERREAAVRTHGCDLDEWEEGELEMRREGRRGPGEGLETLPFQ